MSEKIALVTGSTRGIGQAIALNLARNGYTVGINGRNQKEIDALISHIQKESGKAFGVCLDLTQNENCKKAFQTIKDRYGRLDVLVTNIGQGKSISGWDIPQEEWDRVMSINFYSATMIIQATMSLLQKAKGQIISISSICGVEPLQAPIPYSVAKTALISYIKNLARILAIDGVRVNCISPGNVLFEGGSWEMKLKNDPEKTKKYIQENVPLNTFMSPDDIAHAVMFLIQTQSITAQNIIVDGGQTKNLI